MEQEQKYQLWPWENIEETNPQTRKKFIVKGIYEENGVGYFTGIADGLTAIELLKAIDDLSEKEQFLLFSYWVDGEDLNKASLECIKRMNRKLVNCGKINWNNIFTAWVYGRLFCFIYVNFIIKPYRFQLMERINVSHSVSSKLQMRYDSFTVFWAWVTQKDEMGNLINAESISIEYFKSKASEIQSRIEKALGIKSEIGIRRQKRKQDDNTETQANSDNKQTSYKRTYGNNIPFEDNTLSGDAEISTRDQDARQHAMRKDDKKAIQKRFMELYRTKGKEKCALACYLKSRISISKAEKNKESKITQRQICRIFDRIFNDEAMFTRCHQEAEEFLKIIKTADE